MDNPSEHCDQPSRAEREELDRRVAHMCDRESLIREVMERYKMKREEAIEALEAFGG